MTEAQDSPNPAPPSPDQIARIKQRAAILSVMASTLLTLAKFVAAFLSGSLALLTDALQGLVDIGSTLFTWFAVRAADKPADEGHHYGHGKYEALAALVETAILFAISGAIAWEAGSRLWTGVKESVLVTPMVIGVLLVSMLVDATRWRALRKVAAETRSEALAAEATHFSTDFVATALVLAGLVLVALGVEQADTATAFAIAIFMAITAFRLGRRTVDTLIDAAPDGASERVRAAAERVPGVVAIDRVKVRPGGGAIQGEIGIRVSRTLPLDRVVAIKDTVAEAVAEAEPGAQITITADPVQLDDETVLERALLIAAQMKLPVHHVTAQMIGGKLSIGLDMEVDGRLSLAAAHDLATRLETALRADFGPETEVETHIEPMEMAEAPGFNAGWEKVEGIGRLLADGARAGGIVSEVHSVRVRETPAGLVVHYHCRAPGALDVAAIHDAVDAIERGLRQARPDVCRVVGHAEPLAGEAVGNRQ